MVEVWIATKGKRLPFIRASGGDFLVDDGLLRKSRLWTVPVSA